MFSLVRRIGRAVEGARLESVYRETYREFESHVLRHFSEKNVQGTFLLVRRKAATL